MKISDWIAVAALAGLTFPLGSAAQAKGRISPRALGSIEGDMYMTFMSGETKQAAGQTVWLLPLDIELEAENSAICSLGAADQKRLSDSYEVVDGPLHDSILSAEQRQSAAMNAHNYSDLPPELDGLFARAKRNFNVLDTSRKALRARDHDRFLQMVDRRAVAHAGTGMHAHYQFEKIMPGAYVLYSEWLANDYTRYWWVPVKISKGEHIKKDLDSDNSGDPCRT